MRKIYLDFNASTPLLPEAAKAMGPFLSDYYGNPSSRHWAGLPAREAVENARSQVAGLLGCLPEEIIFTSGGTESNNHALKGTFFKHRDHGKHIITSQVEHPSILQPCRFLEKHGAEITYLPVDRYGRVDPEDVKRSIKNGTILITIMHANNEVGTIQPIVEIAKLARDRNILFHTDAAQSVGKISTKIEELGVDMLSLAGHKLYAPKGVGALYLRKGTQIESLLHGAGHEGGRRAGTENVLLDVGLGAACDISERWAGMGQIEQLRDRFWEMLQEAFGEGIVLNGHPVERLPNTLNVSFVGKVGSEILSELKEVAASTGSACHEGTVELSPVLKAMRIPPEVGMGAIRFSLGRSTTLNEIETVVGRVKEVLK